MNGCAKILACAALLAAVAAAGESAGAAPGKSAETAAARRQEGGPKIAVWPDYLGITLPPNVAPLNFKVLNADGAEPPPEASVEAADGARLEAKADAAGVVRWRPKDWRRFLLAHAGGEIKVRIRFNGAVRVATNRISPAPMDSHLTYRLIPPSYTLFNTMGVYQRDLTGFGERVLVRNEQTDLMQCVNCHTYNRANPDEYLFHTRAYAGGTHVVSPKWGVRKVDLKTPSSFGAGVYPAWHPSGDLIVFSVNETRQGFWAFNPDKIEVVDLRSDLICYSLADNTVRTIEDDPLTFETFPTWSPDGRRLYSCRAKTPFKEMPKDYELRFEQTFGAADQLHYDIVVRDWNPATGAFSAPRTVFDARHAGLSASFPRVSPDGRWLVATVGPYGNFHVWHKASDLWIFDLKERRYRELKELNSAAADTYHTFSSNGRWMVFSSRRIDGVYTRPFFAAFDPERGVFAKPFLLPAENPDDHLDRMLSYNIPEFSAGPVKASTRELGKLAKRPAAKAENPDGRK